MAIEGRLLAQLQEDLRHRRIQRGIEALQDAETQLARLGPATAHAPALLLLLAQWVDLGFRDARFLCDVLSRFPSKWRHTLPVEDYIRLRMAEAFRDLASSELDSAIETLELVLRMLRDLACTAEQALAHFWKGRAHRKKGEYEPSLTDIVSARELAEADGNAVFAAVIRVQESWLIFQKGMAKEALQLLDNAEAVLKKTDHFVSLGNIESARGRVVRRLGEYTKALEHFDRSIAIYSKRDPNHANVARALVNAAYVLRLLALQVRKRVDTRVQSGRNVGRALTKGSDAGRENLRARYQQICAKALQNLMRAREIYERHGHIDGIGNVALNLGFLHLDSGNIESATPEAAEAYRIGQEKNDHILMARARSLQAAIENAHVEEQTGEEVDVAVHANRAREYSTEAIALAKNTQNRRLRAGACIARGITAANELFQDWETARKCASEATAMIGPGESDHLVEDLAWLKSRIVQASGINDTLRSWSEGLVGDKTFQQISEEFAEIVIPKVWARENRKIARVAASLSISPKKVRRILRNVGSLGRE
jgi:tetratricopeptide (TPR) repeat protein